MNDMQELQAFIAEEYTRVDVYIASLGEVGLAEIINISNAEDAPKLLRGARCYYTPSTTASNSATTGTTLTDCYANQPKEHPISHETDSSTLQRDRTRSIALSAT